MGVFFRKFVINKKLRSKVICDFYDVTGMYANYDNLKIAFEEYSIKQDLECEKYIFENADGIIDRYKQSVFVDYAKIYNNNGKILNFNNIQLAAQVLIQSQMIKIKSINLFFVEL